MRDGRPHANFETEPAQYDDVSMDITTRGDLEPSETTDLFCHVKALAGSPFSSTIKWIAAPGAWVKRGDLVVQLDDAAHVEDLAQRRVPLEQARADWLLAAENHKIVLSQNASDIAAAEGAARLAELDLKKYIEADHEQTRKDILGRLKLAEADLLGAREHLAFTVRMNRRGFASDSQARAERNRTEAMRLTLETTEEALATLDSYGHPRALAEFQAKADEARRAVQLARRQARSKEIQADIDRLSKQRVYQKLLTRYHEIEAEVAKCRIVAPHDGMVLYHMSDQSRTGYGNYQAIVAEGEQVREGQKLVRIAQLKRLLVRTWIQEASIGHVHGEDEMPSREAFQKALIKVDALPDRVYHGHVKVVGTVPSMINGRMDGTQYFRATIVIDDPVDTLRPDMSARVTILESDAPHQVLTVPVDAILPGVGSHRKLYVLNEEGPQEREVVVGYANEDVAQIVSGLEAGEEVVVNPEEVDEERGHLGSGVPSHRRAHRR
jgi:multidrug efflux pump subunit AcrA (membrane-fusion protein)